MGKANLALLARWAKNQFNKDTEFNQLGNNIKRKLKASSDRHITCNTNLRLFNFKAYNKTLKFDVKASLYEKSDKAVQWQPLTLSRLNLINLITEDPRNMTDNKHQTT